MPILSGIISTLSLHNILSTTLSLALIILFQLLGDFFQRYFNTPIPGSVIGMSLFFLYLCITGNSNSKVMEAGNNLLKYLPLLFIPAGVGIITYTHELKTQGLAIIASLTLGTLIAFVLTLLIFKKSSRNNNV